MRSVLVSLLLTLCASVRTRAVLQLEILALQHQLQVLERSRRRRVRLMRLDRVLSHRSAETMNDRSGCAAVVVEQSAEA